MDRSRVAYLISKTYKTDALYQLVAEEEKRKVFCNVSSVSASEFFSAGEQGLRAELRVTLFAPNYKGEDEIELGGIRYEIYRTYVGSNESIDLYLSRKVGNV